MAKTEWMKAAVRAGKKFHIQHQKPWKHNTLNITLAILLWCLCVLCFFFAQKISLLPLFFLSLFTGCLFFAHFILIIHEASHNMFIVAKTPQKTKKINRILGIMSSIPFFTEYVLHWEQGHLSHHLHPCENDDPQNPNPLYGKSLYVELTRLWLIPFYFIKINPSSKYPKILRRFILGLTFWSIFLYYVFSWQSLVMFFLAWNMVNSLNLLKIAQEHGGDLSKEQIPLLRSRTYFYCYPLQLLCSPFCINYHFEHHANFNVPWYRLPEYHKEMLSIVPPKLHPYYFNREYLLQLQGKKGLPNRVFLTTY